MRETSLKDSAVSVGDGTTFSERYLARLCRQTFLRLWSWPNLHRREPGKAGSLSKEVCDLLVVFPPHVIIFSDKYCAFPASGNLELDWTRWFRRAVWRSAEQVWGAERWIRDARNELYLDPACKEKLPVRLPGTDEIVVHRIVVAHGAGERCRHELGGTGSLLVVPDIAAKRHFDPSTGPIRPFSVGTLSESEGFVHVVDDATLDVLVRTLDTVGDFVNYLAKKEQLVAHGGLLSAAGEEELLAWYLQRVNESGEHDFNVPSDTQLVLLEGGWERFREHPDRLAQLQANEVSYAWDVLIEKFSHHVLQGSLHFGSDLPVSEHELGLRFLAGESRTARRMLAKAILGIINRGIDVDRAARVVPSSDASRPHYVFVSLRQPPDVSRETYREVRRNLLSAYALVVKLKFPEARHIVGIATEPANCGADQRSEDLIYYDAIGWNRDTEKEARRFQEEHGLLRDTRFWNYHESEYPRAHLRSMKKGRNRNQVCPCGSGRKFKKCCGLAASERAG